MMPNNLGLRWGLLCLCAGILLTSASCTDDDTAENNNTTKNNTTNNMMVVCGDGKVEGDERCDGNCPADASACNDNDVCTTDGLTGAASSCDATCTNTAITQCANDDGCCAPGCDNTTDNDCPAPPMNCGNGMLDAGERCDGDCPADAAACNDNDACTIDGITGSAAMCDAACTNVAVTQCANDDGCCAPNCDNTNDNDCPAPPMNCGNGMLDAGETCDGDCPADAAACGDNNACTTDTLTGSATMCDAVCANAPITQCVNDDGCCAPNCDNANDNDCPAPPMNCGNGMLDPGEACDGNCPADVMACNDNNTCTTDSLMGAAATCDARCTNAPISACTNGDGCCPNGCDNANDNDCPLPNLCGNGMLDAGESCDGNCPTNAAACNDNNACTTERVMGDAAACTAACVSEPVTTCRSSDGCCPAGCNPLNDNDCQPTTFCGNGRVEGNETCDGNCPANAAACGDNNACTTDTIVGSAAMCNAQCINTAITMCRNNDGCCPSSCTNANDNDCQMVATCGNGMLDLGETCDGNCPTNAAACNDNNACTQDGVSGNPMTCTSQCVNNPINICVNGDGCCPQGCVNATDSDCAPLGPVGSACTQDDQCQSFGALSPFCLTGVLGGYCTQFSCQADNECSPGSHCFEDNNICLKTCTTNANCRQGYACGDLGDGKRSCIPDLSNPQGADPGQACQQNNDCKGTVSGGGLCLTQASTSWPGGACLGNGCSNDAECPSGSHCDSGLCFDDCNTNADCRQGYACSDFFATGRRTCAPQPNAGAPIGGACNNDAACLGGIGASTCFQDSGWSAGYCTTGCSTDAFCQAGSHCGYQDANGDGLCVDQCNADTDCRPGYQCLDNDQDNKRECIPSATGTGAVGATCTSLADCSGGQQGSCLGAPDQPDFAGGYCARSCFNNSDCGAGAHCGFFDAQTGQGTCVDTCVNNNECRSGYLCRDNDQDNTRECLPGATGTNPVGAACNGVYQCAGGLNGVCLRSPNQPDWRDGYCAINNCTANSCGAGTQCSFIDPQTGTGICLDSCANNNQCRPLGYQCYDIDGDARNECAPSGTGAGVTGAACAGIFDCTGGQNVTCITTTGDAAQGNLTQWPNGYCNQNCTVSNTCSGDGACIAFGDGTSSCFDVCANNADCRQGYVCNTTALNRPVCLPF